MQSLQTYMISNLFGVVRFSLLIVLPECPQQKNLLLVLTAHITNQLAPSVLGYCVFSGKLIKFGTSRCTVRQYERSVDFGVTMLELFLSLRRHYTSDRRFACLPACLSVAGFVHHCFGQAIHQKCVTTISKPKVSTIWCVFMVKLKFAIYRVCSDLLLPKTAPLQTDRGESAMQLWLTKWLTDWLTCWQTARVAVKLVR